MQKNLRGSVISATKLEKNGVGRSKLRDEKTQVNLTEKDLCIVLTEINMVENNPRIGGTTQKQK